MDGLPFNITDLLIVAILALSGFFAFIRGFVHELLAVVAWIGAGLATLYGYPVVKPIVQNLTSYRGVAEIGAGVALFLVVLIALTVLTRMLANRVQNSSLSALDRSLGLLFGILRGAALVSLTWLALSWAVPARDLPEWITEARSLPRVEEGKNLLLALIPAEMRPRTTPYRKELGLEQDSGFEELVTPQPKAPGPDEPSGYKDQERKDLQRLIESAQ